MRQIGTLSNSKDAERFVAYLVTQGIGAQSEEDNGQWIVWVRDEDQLTPARAALTEYKFDPEHAKFQGVEQVAEQKRREEASKREAARHNVVTMGQRWRGPGGGLRRPLTLVVLFVCAAIGVMTNMGEDPANPITASLQFRNLSTEPPTIGINDKLVDVQRGQLWRIVTPIFLHFGAFHLVFNLVMFYQMGSIIEHRRGTIRLALLILALAIPSNLAQALAPNEWGGGVNFAGMSGVVFGLLGYNWMKSRFEPALGLYISRSSLFSALIFLALGLAGAFNVGGIRMANWAHTVGFAMGIAIGYAPILWRSMNRPAS
jgi:GlpG protein